MMMMMMMKVGSLVFCTMLFYILFVLVINVKISLKLVTS